MQAVQAMMVYVSIRPGRAVHTVLCRVKRVVYIYIAYIQIPQLLVIFNFRACTLLPIRFGHDLSYNFTYSYIILGVSHVKPTFVLPVLIAFDKNPAWAILYRNVCMNALINLLLICYSIAYQ